jgi:hypothetical protein
MPKKFVASADENRPRKVPQRMLKELESRTAQTVPTATSSARPRAQ